MKNVFVFILLSLFCLSFTEAQQDYSSSCPIYSINGTEIDFRAGLFRFPENDISISEVLSGKDFTIGLSIPGITNCAGGKYKVLLITSPNLIHNVPNYVSDPFLPSGNANSYVAEFSNSQDFMEGKNILTQFRFPSGITCDKEVGTITAVLQLYCGQTNAITRQCTLKFSINARAESYWKVEKKYFGPNPALRGGQLIWEITVKNANPNILGQGDLNIANGSIITDAVSGINHRIVRVMNETWTDIIPVTPGTTQVSWYVSQSVTTELQKFYVVSESCDSSLSVMKNCVSYKFCLGKKKSIILQDGGGEVTAPSSGVLGKSSKLTENGVSKKGKTPSGELPFEQQFQSCCKNISEKDICTEIKLTDSIVVRPSIRKVLTPTYPAVNLSPGCEGQYTIIVRNGGNVPLTNVVIEDLFPNEIEVVRIVVRDFPGWVPPYTIYNPIPPNSPGYTFNTPVNNYSNNFSGPVYPNLLKIEIPLFQLHNYMEIRVTFRVKSSVSPGSIVSNCAKIPSYGQGAILSDCPPPLIPNFQPTPVESCVKFTVEKPRPIPGIKKCILNGTSTFRIGDEIQFQILVSNSGGAPYSGNLQDLLNQNGQNLELVPGSIEYFVGSGPYNSISGNKVCDVRQTITWQAFNNPDQYISINQPTSNTQLNWSISNLPGNCIFGQANYLVIEFRAKVLPQVYGLKKNKVTLDNLSDSVYYWIPRIASLIVNKGLSEVCAEAGQNVEYLIDLVNTGTVKLGNLNVKDLIPSCIEKLSGLSGQIIRADGTHTIVPVGYTSPDNYYPSTAPTIINPGDVFRVIIPVRLKSDSVCCNPYVEGTARCVDNYMLVRDDDQNDCIKSCLCCEIKGLQIQHGSSVNPRIGPVASFILSGSILPIQEVSISLIDHHWEYSDPACEPVFQNTSVGNIRPVNALGFNYNTSPPNTSSSNPHLSTQISINTVQNSITWINNPDPIYLNQMTMSGSFVVSLDIPHIVNLKCCAGTYYYCFLVRVKDVNCNVCERRVCGQLKIPHKKSNPKYLPLNISNEVESGGQDSGELQQWLDEIRSIQEYSKPKK
jgi:uncharacterized repeat protein (TIGR01451 family)